MDNTSSPKNACYDALRTSFRYSAISFIPNVFYASFKLMELHLEVVFIHVKYLYTAAPRAWNAVPPAVRSITESWTVEKRKNKNKLIHAPWLHGDACVENWVRQAV